MSEWQDIFKVMKERTNVQQSILYPASLSFRTEGEVKNFIDKLQLKEFNNTKLVLKKM